MRGRNTWDARQGSVLFLVIILSMALAFAVTILLHHAEVEARATRVRLGSVRALYQAYAELENAKTVIAEADYDGQGHNVAVVNAMAAPDRKVDGTEAVIDPLTGDGGTWYTLTVSAPYAEVYERVVNQAFREIDFFSSYNLFVSDDPAGISGSPVGAIHSNEQMQFYFPGGAYRHAVTSVTGYTYKSGATADNTTVLGPFDPTVERIELDYEGNDRYNLAFIQANAEANFNFDPTLDTRLRFYIEAGQQWVQVERWTKPTAENVTESVVMGYNNVNPHDQEYTYVEQVSVGFEERTRNVQIFDHYETVTTNTQVPVYVQDVHTVQVPVYVDETRTRDVPIYIDETRTRTVTEDVWVAFDGGTGGTTVGGEGGNLGYWAPMEVDETYTVRVIDHYETQEYTVKVVDHYDDQEQTYQRLDHYDTVPQSEDVAIYRTETETYQEEIFENVVRTDTRTVYDQEPIYQEQTSTVYVEPVRVSEETLQAPENGLIFSEGDIKSVKGDIIDRMTIATQGSMLITGDIVYRDTEGDPAYVNGTQPWLPYEPNPDYSNYSSLGLIAQEDIIYSRDMRDNSEINASILAITGRVGIEGITLDDDGEVLEFNRLTDEWGRPVDETFRKNSIRRLGGITTARRPVETVVRDGEIVSGFNVGQSVFDVGLLEGPPPFFLAYPVPRFFATSIVK